MPIAPEKTVGPSTILTFAAIQLDTNTMEARLPADKILKTHSILSKFLCRKKAQLKEVQSLIGMLNFACTVVLPGRAFLQRLIDLTKGINAPLYRIRRTRSVKADLGLCKFFLDDFNGWSFILSDDWLPSNVLNLYTDAAGGLGFGAIFGNFWCYGPWSDEWKKLNIVVLEFFPIVLSVILWGHMMRNHRILFYTDNAALVEIIKTISRDSTVIYLSVSWC